MDYTTETINVQFNSHSRQPSGVNDNDIHISFTIIFVTVKTTIGSSLFQNQATINNLKKMVYEGKS